MPNAQNITRPLLVAGAGRTASSYVLDRLRHGQGEFYNCFENDMFEGVYKALTETDWAARGAWKNIGDEAEIERRIVACVRNVLLTALPSDQPHWVMKIIWGGHDPEVVDLVFPESKILHLTRDPRTNIASMMEFMGKTLEQGQISWINSNRNALEFEAWKGRYLRVKQESFLEDRTGTWTEICKFLDVAEPSPDRWEREMNRSPSAKGSASDKKRDTSVKWSDLSPELVELATQLGYSA